MIGFFRDKLLSLTFLGESHANLPAMEVSHSTVNDEMVSIKIMVHWSSSYVHLGFYGTCIVDSCSCFLINDDFYFAALSSFFLVHFCRSYLGVFYYGFANSGRKIAIA